jgi:TetR/AcrR family transcriptional repressor of nem operon
MLVNAALEHEVADRDFRAIVSTFLDEAEAFFLRCMVAGQREGTISTTQSAEDLARMLFGQLLGIRVLARVKPDRELLEGMVRPVFDLLFSGGGLRLKARRKARSRT